VIAIHDVISHSGTPFNKLTALSRRILLSKFDKFLTFSPSQANLLKNITNKRSIHMIPLALKSFGDLPQYQKNKVKTNFLFFGNIKTYKGLDILLKSINRLSEKYNSFTLTIAGRCADWIESYEPLIKNRKIVNAVIRFIDNDEIPYFFSRADYLILPYRDATQSGPLMIAYNYNIPVIASNIDGFKEFIEDKKTGFLFDPSSSESIDKVLEDAILRDEVTYNTLCTNVNHYKQNQLSVEQTAKSYGILFDTVIKTRKND
jgi:glycosyltransferase involved in cell wall biosynthesis